MPTIRVAEPPDLAEIVQIDDSASELYARAGLLLSLSADHPFAQAERARWLRAIGRQWLFLAVETDQACLGFAALDRVDDAPYLDQLAVRCSAMRRGVGRQLLRHAVRWASEQSGSRDLWLTTYGHLPWNRPYYEREGFVVVPESECGPGIRHHLDEQRRFLPVPEQRIVMRRAAGRV